MLSHFSQVWLFVTLWTVACQTPLSMGFSRQEYWNGCHAFLRGFFQPKDQIYHSYIFCTGGGFFTTVASWEAQPSIQAHLINSFQVDFSTLFLWWWQSLNMTFGNIFFPVVVVLKHRWENVPWGKPSLTVFIKRE